MLTLLRVELPAHMVTESAFGRKVLLDPNFDPDGAIVARDAGGNVAGLLLSITREALLYRSLNSMRQNGARRAWFMWTGDGPAKRVYSPAGFVETNRYSIMVKKL